MQELNTVIDLLYEGGTPMQSLNISEKEAIALVEDKAPHKPWCVVKNWIWVDLDLSPDNKAVMQQAGHSPVMLYAHSVINDSRSRFRTGD